MQPTEASKPPSPAAPRRVPPRPRSTIARLPLKVREYLNHALREGEPYEQIAARVAVLVGRDKPIISYAMLSRWIRTGYLDWLRQQTQLENTIAQNTAALAQLVRLKNESGASLADLTEAFLAGILQKVLQDFDPASLKSLLAEKPAEFFRLVSCLSSHIAARSRDKAGEVQRLRCQVELAEKAQSTRTDPDPSLLIWERQIVDKAFGGPLDSLKRLAHDDTQDAQDAPQPGKAAPTPAPNNPARRRKSFHPSTSPQAPAPPPDPEQPDAPPPAPDTTVP